MNSRLRYVLERFIFLAAFILAAGKHSTVHAQFRLQETGGGAEYVGFSAPAAITTNILWTLPAADGSANQCLATDGAGGLSWITPAATGGDGHSLDAADGSPTDAVYVNDDGKVGVGTTDPQYNLHVSSAIDPAAVLVEGIGLVGPNFMGRRSNGTPASKTQALAGDNLAILSGRGFHSGGSYSPTANVAVDLQAAENFTATAQGTQISFRTTGVGTTVPNYRMRIASEGNVGIGTTAPSVKLHVSTDGTSATALTGNGQIAINSAAPQINFNDTDHGDWAIHVNSNKLYFIREPWIASDLVLDGTGNVGIGTAAPSQKLHVVGSVLATDYLYTSDGRLKTAVEDIQGLETVLRLHGVRFRWKDSGEPEYGLIAQEVEAVLPELVVTDPVSGLKSVKYGNIVAPLIESVKDLYGLYEQLMHENRALKVKNEELETRLKKIEKKLESRESG